MTDSEIETIASQVLRERLGQFGFQSARAYSEVDFDGSPVIRVMALYANETAPTREVTQSLHQIRSELLRRGEQRFVLLEGQYGDADSIDEDVD